jgi:hypothetical protein
MGFAKEHDSAFKKIFFKVIKKCINFYLSSSDNMLLMA